jgi:hypothetical protein
MLEAFAKTHQFRIRPDYKEELQKTLDASFSLKDTGLVRSFGQLSSLVNGESIWLFRAVELLDLNPYAQSYSANFSRIVALFDISTDLDEFFILGKSMQVMQRRPGSDSPSSRVIEITKRVSTTCKARHPLSVTLTHGHGLIYFEPLVTGGETLSDVNSLYCIAKQLHSELSGNI